MAKIIRDLLNRVDIDDPHAFATAYVNHCEARNAERMAPMPVAVAVQRWVSFRTV